MTWVVPEPDPVDEPFAGSERASLDGFLEAQRYQLVRRCAGLDGARLADRAVPPSSLSLLGLMRHVTDVERHWICNRFGGEERAPLYPDPFGPGGGGDASAVHRALLGEWASSRAVLAGLELDATYDHPAYGPMSLRWLYSHLIREYAGHIGHADLLRQRIDGTTFS